jgi:hypothetical protein
MAKSSNAFHEEFLDRAYRRATPVPQILEGVRPRSLVCDIWRKVLSLFAKQSHFPCTHI